MQIQDIVDAQANAVGDYRDSSQLEPEFNTRSKKQKNAGINPTQFRTKVRKPRKACSCCAISLKSRQKTGFLRPRSNSHSLQPRRTSSSVIPIIVRWRQTIRRSCFSGHDIHRAVLRFSQPLRSEPAWPCSFFQVQQPCEQHSLSGQGHRGRQADGTSARHCRSGA